MVVVEPKKYNNKWEICYVDDSGYSRSLVCKKSNLRNPLETSGRGDLQLQMVGGGLQKRMMDGRMWPATSGGRRSFVN
ncbi:hypothetical protein N665_0664s0006 [Sinapis alba]|nr:hypothetical protein N665_0664s0006 [Sinapis alba]